ncbi:hypothetical protein AGMMS49992_26820 [Clostridia bacterium]|nr:hypothetical protein AGMMS49992_26820 [Clostridia bacterium]
MLKMQNEHTCWNGYELLPDVAIFKAKNDTGSWYLQVYDVEEDRFIYALKIQYCPYCGKCLKY